MALIPTTNVSVSPDDYKRKIAYALMQQGMDTSPVQAWTQGAARALQGGLGGYEMYKDEQQKKSDEADATKAYLSFLQPQAPQPSPSVAPTPAPASQPAAPSPVASALAKPVVMASNDPTAVTGPRPGGPVMPTNKVWGDQEAEAAGLYEPSKNTKVAQALAPPAAPSAPAPASSSDDDAAKARIATLLQSPNKAERQLGKSLAENYLTSSLTPSFEFKTAGDTLYRTNSKKGTAEAVKDVGRSVKPMSEAERKAWKVPEGVAAGLDDNGKPVFSQPSNINTVSPVIAGVNDRFDAAIKSAQAAPQVISSIHEARRALDSGAITGAMADPKLFLAKIGTAFGLPNDAVANTEVARAALGTQVLESAKTLGANPSNADRDYIEKVKGGSIKLDEGSMRRLLDMQEKWARDGVKRSNDMAEKMISTDPEKLSRFRPMMKVDEPLSYDDYIKANPGKTQAPAAPSGVDPAAYAEAKRRGLIK
jgi:hypothetical protein